MPILVGRKGGGTYLALEIPSPPNAQYDDRQGQKCHAQRLSQIPQMHYPVLIGRAPHAIVDCGVESKQLRHRDANRRKGERGPEPS